MGNQKWSDHLFGERVKRARADRSWSQADMAKLLADKGVQPMHATTVAKIEAGDRSVRINEAVGIADLLGVSLDTLVGRTTGPADADLAFALRVLRDSARRSADEALDLARDIRLQARTITSNFEFDGNGELDKLADTACRRLDSAYSAVFDLADHTDDVLRTKTTAVRKQPEKARAVKA